MAAHEAGGLDALTSKSERLTPVNAFQASEFHAGIASRDPMFQTFATLMEVEGRGGDERPCSSTAPPSTPR